MKELTKDIDRTQVAGIGFGGQMHGLVTLDKDDNVIRPAILWNDGRTGEETEYLNTVIGKEKLSEYTANIAFAGFTAPKILWMQKNEPENFKKVVKIMLPKDYLAYRLSGSFCTDVSDASGMLLLDVKNRCWSKEMLEICGITEEQLPKLYESWEVVGTLKPEIAKELGFSEDVKLLQVPEIMRQQLLEQVQLVTDSAIFLLEHPELYLFPARTLVWMKTMHFILSAMQMEVII